MHIIRKELMKKDKNISIGAVKGSFAWDENGNNYYLCKCERCVQSFICTEKEAKDHENLCLQENAGQNTNSRVLKADRTITAVGLVVETEKYGKVECIAYRGSRDVDVKFLDTGTIVTNREWKSFIKGGIKDPNRSKFLHVGEVNQMNCGMNAKITVWRKYHDIDVEFEDGYRLNSVSYTTFKSGELRNPNVKRTQSNRVGESTVNCQGMEMEIITYREADDIDVKFSDGTIVTSRYRQFIKGGIINPNIKSHHLGEKSRAHNGLMMEIIEYTKSDNIRVLFEDGEVKKTIYSSFKEGCVKHPSLWIRKNGEYKGFKTVFQWEEEDKTVYQCECKKCGKKSLMTPQEMIEHRKYC